MPEVRHIQVAFNEWHRKDLQEVWLCCFPRVRSFHRAGSRIAIHLRGRVTADTPAVDAETVIEHPW